jgi:hypothetical protein
MIRRFKPIRRVFVESFKKCVILLENVVMTEDLLSIRSGVRAPPESPSSKPKTTYKINKLETKSINLVHLTKFVVFCSNLQKTGLLFVDFSWSDLNA